MAISLSSCFNIYFFNRLVCYAIVGGVGTLAHWFLYYSLVRYFEVKAVPASSLGFILGALINYFLNYFITFKSKVNHSRATARFASFAIALFFVNTGLIHVCVNSYGLHPYLSQFLASGAVLLAGYSINKMWTF